MNLNLNELAGRVKLTILSLPAEGKFFIGLIKKIEFEKINYTFNANINAKFIDNTGFCKQGVNNLGLLLQGNIIELALRKNQFRMSCNGKKANFAL
jgi:hypothetical protein